MRRVFFLSVILVTLFLMAAFAGSLLYPAPDIRVSDPPPPLKEIFLDLPGGEKIACWMHQQNPQRPVLIYFHGNGENLETLRLSGLIHSLLQLNSSFLAVDYPGYGNSNGRPSEKTIREAARAAWDYVSENFLESKKILVGWSLGAAVAIQLASEQKVDGLIAMSCWESLQATARIHYPGWLTAILLREKYDSLAVAGKIQCPVLLIHGERDNLIPASQGKRVAERIGSKARWILLRNTGHNDLLSRREVWQEITEFIHHV